MKRIIYIFGLIVFVLTGYSCSDSNSDSTDATFIEIYDTDTTSLKTYYFTTAASSKMVAINSDGDWTAYSNDTSWLTITPHAGYGYSDGKLSYIKMSVEKNTSSSRNGMVIITSGSVSDTLIVVQNGVERDEGDTFETGWDFVNNLVMGYNLGNTLDASQDLAQSSSWFNPKTVYDWETCWGQPVTTQEIIDSIAAMGFNAIRVPVTWFPHMDSEGTVDEAWMDRVEVVVNYVLNAGCYCILNVQHDSGDKGTRTDSIGWIVADMDQYDAVSPRFKYLWKQIAERFRDYGEKLLFEAFNEILDENYTWTNPSKSSAYEAVNKLEQDFVDVVRATGGNNEYRNLVCNPYSAGNSAEKMKGWTAPSDIHSNHILGSVHSYDPYNFCQENKDTTRDYNIYVFDSSCEEEIDDVIKRVDNRYTELGVPYFYGEFGAIDEKKKEMSERVKYATYVATAFKEKGTSGLWWMGLFNRSTLTWYEMEIVNALKAVFEQ